MGRSQGESPSTRWPSKAVVAQLNSVFDIDADVAATSLEPDHLDQTFPDRIEEYVVFP